MGAASCTAGPDLGPPPAGRPAPKQGRSGGRAAAASPQGKKGRGGGARPRRPDEGHSFVETTLGCDTCAANIVNCKKVPVSLAWGHKFVMELRLIRASQEGDLDKIQSLLKAGAFVDARRRPTMRPRGEVEGFDPLGGAAGCEGPDASADEALNVNFGEVLELDERGAFLKPGQGQQAQAHGHRGEGLTALMCAAKEGHAKAVQLLLSARASPYAQDEDGMRPLHFAAEAGCVESCRALLRAGADAEAVDDFGRDARACLPREALLRRADRDLWEALLSPAPTAPPDPGARGAPDGDGAGYEGGDECPAL